jgi:serine/alanine adding enzyme
MAEYLLTTSDSSAWRSRLPATRSVFGSVEYARIFEEHSRYSARLFVVEHNGSSMVYPFFLRPSSDLPFAADGFEPFWDTLSPEYTGPLSCSPPSPALDTRFEDKWIALCQAEHIVAEFAHLHPWGCQYGCLEPAAIQLNREIVYVDLTWSTECLWNDSFTYACRKNISRAQREGVRVITAQRSSDVDDFYRIYIQTMDRNQASRKYYFPLHYFMDFFQLMPQHARFALALFQDKIVAGTLFLHDDDSIYSYLGGADHAFQRVRPTNAIIYETIRWGQSLGKRRLILGAGYKPDDGIFRFKSSFSPLAAKFHVYKRIHLPREYEILCKAWSEYYRRDLDLDGYFPAYRSASMITE